ncbi:MAG: hypothetical protein QM270_02310 [Bacillota bacterium]|nr:hypothetical protein [Bacillota bacterium]
MAGNGNAEVVAMGTELVDVLLAAKALIHHNVQSGEVQFLKLVE